MKPDSSIQTLLKIGCPRLIRNESRSNSDLSSSLLKVNFSEVELDRKDLNEQNSRSGEIKTNDTSSRVNERLSQIRSARL